MEVFFKQFHRDEKCGASEVSLLVDDLMVQKSG